MYRGDSSLDIEEAQGLKEERGANQECQERGAHMQHTGNRQKDQVS